MPDKSAVVSAVTLFDTLRTSAETVSESLRGRLTFARANERLMGWARRVVSHASVTVRIQGLAHRDAERAYVMMSNHQSHFDVPVLYYALGANMRMVAKKELFDIPLFGPAMRRAGFIEVDRADHTRAIESLDKARDAVERGLSIWIAPEGTRSPTGELLPFKKGGFFIAMQAGAPILPITVKGTREVLPAHDLVMRPNRIVDVIVHEPIDVARHTRDELMTRVRSAIESGL